MDMNDGAPQDLKENKNNTQKLTKLKDALTLLENMPNIVDGPE